eukprot:2571348-Pleurochrysis_carterae.AAC.1
MLSTSRARVMWLVRSSGLAKNWCGVPCGGKRREKKCVNLLALRTRGACGLSGRPRSKWAYAGENLRSKLGRMHKHVHMLKRMPRLEER